MESNLSARIIQKALLSRRVEEALLHLFSEGKLFGTVHTCIGQEFSGAVVSEFIQSGDHIFSNHRCHGHFLSITGDLNGLIAEIMGRTTGVCGGHGGSQHLYKDGFFSNGIQGGMTPIAAGIALASKKQPQKSPRKIAVSFIGDGTLGEGVLYETMNIASKWQLPVMFILENNGFAQSTNQEQTLAGSILKRADAFGIDTYHGNTWDWEGLHGVASQAFKMTREEGRPAFLLIDTFRLKAHSKGDDNRPRSFVEPYELKDPLNILLSQGQLAGLDSKIQQEISAAIASADQAPYATLDSSSVKTIDDRSQFNKTQWRPVEFGAKTRVVKAVNEALLHEFQSKPDLLMVGEDIESPYGGAFKVSQGLSTEFPDRVLNAPISEAAIAGIATGLTLGGIHGIAEIMFGDFSTLIVDQVVNHAAKFRQMYNQQVACYPVFRTPMGGGRGYGPTHSQSLERIFFGVPGLQVVATNTIQKATELWSHLANQKDGPVLVIENKLMYAFNTLDRVPEGYELLRTEDPLPIFYLKPKSAKCHVTLIGYGGLTPLLIETAESLFQKHDLIVQLIVPTRIYPFEVRSILNVLVDCPNLVFIEEGQNFAAFASEFTTQCLELAPEIPWKIKRVGPKVCAIPSAGPTEQQALPVNVDYIIDELKDFINEWS